MTAGKTNHDAARREMTPKQRLFALEYLTDLNAKRSAIAAGYSAKTAEQQGYQLLQHPSVAAYISDQQAKQAEKLGVTRDKVVSELVKLGFTNLSDVADWGEREVSIGYDSDGKRLAPADIGDAVTVHREMAPYLSLRNRDDLPEAAKAAVSEVALTKDGFKVKMHDKVGALEKLGRHLGLFKEEPGAAMTVRFIIEGLPEGAS